MIKTKINIFVVLFAFSCTPKGDDSDSTAESAATAVNSGLQVNSLEFSLDQSDLGTAISDESQTGVLTLTTNFSFTASEISLNTPFSFTGNEFPGVNGNCSYDIVTGCTVEISFSPEQPGSYEGLLSFSIPVSGSVSIKTIPFSGTSNAFAYGFTGEGDGQITSLTELPDGSNFITSYVTNSASFPGQSEITGNGSINFFISSVSKTGEIRFLKIIEGSSTHQANESTYSNACDCVIVVGEFQGTVDFDPSTAVANETASANRDVFVVKYSRDGAYISHVAFGGDGDDYFFGITSDESGDVYINGTTISSTIDLDPGAGTQTVTNTGSSTGFVLKLNSNLEYQWHYATENGSTTFNSSAAIASNYLFVQGYTTSTVDFDNSPATVNRTSATPAAVLLKLNLSTGAYIDDYYLDAPDVQSGSNLTTDGENLYWGCQLDNTGADLDLDLGPGVTNVRSNGSRDLVLIALDVETLDFQWGHGWGADGYDSLEGIAIDANGVLVVGGSIRGDGDVEPGPGSKTISTGAFSFGVLYRFRNDGEVLETRLIESDLQEHINVKSISADSSGNYTLGGYVSGNGFLSPESSEGAFTGGATRVPFLMKLSY